LGGGNGLRTGNYKCFLVTDKNKGNDKTTATTKANCNDKSRSLRDDKQKDNSNDKKTTATTNTGILRLRVSQNAVRHFAQDDAVFLAYKTVKATASTKANR
jgi:hypothetical protein